MLTLLSDAREVMTLDRDFMILCVLFRRQLRFLIFFFNKRQIFSIINLSFKILSDNDQRLTLANIRPNAHSRDHELEPT